MRIALFATWPNGQKVSVANAQGRTIGHSHYCPILKRQVYRVTETNKKDIFQTIFGRARSLNPSLPMFMLETDEVNDKGERILTTLDLDKELVITESAVQVGVQLMPQTDAEIAKVAIETSYKEMVQKAMEKEGPKEAELEEPEDKEEQDVPLTLEEEIFALTKDFGPISMKTVARNLQQDIAVIAEEVKNSKRLIQLHAGAAAQIALKQ